MAMIEDEAEEMIILEDVIEEWYSALLLYSIFNYKCAHNWLCLMPSMRTVYDKRQGLNFFAVNVFSVVLVIVKWDFDLPDQLWNSNFCVKPRHVLFFRAILLALCEDNFIYLSLRAYFTSLFRDYGS